MMSGGNYLSAATCSTEVSLAEISGAEDGACQMWRLASRAAPANPAVRAHPGQRGLLQGGVPGPGRALDLPLQLFVFIRLAALDAVDCLRW